MKSRFGEHIWLDITLLGEAHIHRNLREVFDICHYFLGVDPTKEMIPVRPAQHYTMGGVRTNYTGESPTLKGLFAAGEAACWDMHGFNRLGGNSVAETVVAGMIVGEFIADFCDKSENDVNIPTGVVREFLQREQAKLNGILLGRGTEDAERDQGSHAGDHDRARSASSAAARTSSQPSTSCRSCWSAAAISACVRTHRASIRSL